MEVSAGTQAFGEKSRKGSLAEYRKKTATAAAKLQESKETRKKLQLLSVNRGHYKLDLHVALIDAIIEAHSGANEILIEYRVTDLILDEDGRKDVIDVLAKFYIGLGWNVSQPDKGLLLKSYPDDQNEKYSQLEPEYNARSYLRYVTQNPYTLLEGQTTIDFYVPDSFSNHYDIGETFCIFGEYIRVKLWGLQIPLEQVCKNVGSPANKKSRLPEVDIEIPSDTSSK